jgi:hypothetical protein
MIIWISSKERSPAYYLNAVEPENLEEPLKQQREQLLSKIKTEIITNKLKIMALGEKLFEACFTLKPRLLILIFNNFDLAV